jgi:glyoxylate/hydroxypyruvate reductase
MDSASGASGILVMLSDKVTSDLLEKAGPSLRVISTMSVGYEHVDLSAITRYGVKLGYTPDVLTDAVADLSIMLALMAGRNGGKTISVVNNGEVHIYLFIF